LGVLAICWALSDLFSFWSLKRLVFWSITRKNWSSLRNQISGGRRAKLQDFTFIHFHYFCWRIMSDRLSFFIFNNLNIFNNIFLNIYLRPKIFSIIAIYNEIIVKFWLILNLFIYIIIWIMNTFLLESIRLLQLNQSLIWFWIIFLDFPCIHMVYQLDSSLNKLKVFLKILDLIGVNAPRSWNRSKHTLINETLLKWILCFMKLIMLRNQYAKLILSAFLAIGMCWAQNHLMNSAMSVIISYVHVSIICLVFDSVLIWW